MGRHSTEMNRFNAALKQALSVSPEQLRQREEEWKREKAHKKRGITHLDRTAKNIQASQQLLVGKEKKQKSKTSASGRVSGDED